MPAAAAGPAVAGGLAVAAGPVVAGEPVVKKMHLFISMKRNCLLLR